MSPTRAAIETSFFFETRSPESHVRLRQTRTSRLDFVTTRGIISFKKRKSLKIPFDGDFLFRDTFKELKL